MSFFFRDQSEQTMNKLIERAGDAYEVFDKVEEYAFVNDWDLDMIEEMFYDESVEEIAEEIGIELEEEEEDE